MKIVFAAVLVAVAAVSPVLAAPAPAPMAAPAAAPAPKLSVDTPIETLVADPRAKAVLDADLPGVTTHPMYDSFKSMSLTELEPMSHGKITDELLAKVATDLAAMK